MEAGCWIRMSGQARMASRDSYEGQLCYSIPTEGHALVYPVIQTGKNIYV